MHRLGQGGSGGQGSPGQEEGAQRGAAVFVKLVAISRVCASEEKEPRWLWVVKLSSDTVQSWAVNSS